MKRVRSFSALEITTASVVMLISAVAIIFAQDREYGDKLLSSITLRQLMSM